MFVINIGRFVIVRPIIATGSGKKVLDCPEPVRVNRCQDSLKSLVTFCRKAHLCLP